MPEELMIELFRNVPVLIIAMFWIKSERDAHRASLQFYRGVLRDNLRGAPVKFEEPL